MIIVNDKKLVHDVHFLRNQPCKLQVYNNIFVAIAWLTFELFFEPGEFNQFVSDR